MNPAWISHDPGEQLEEIKRPTGRNIALYEVTD